MREIYLIARREYLAYVGAWGFWASLLATPLIIAALALAPLLLTASEPTRHAVVLGDPADAAVIAAALNREEPTGDRAGLAGVEAGPAQAATAPGPSRPRWRVVPAPANNIDGLRPYLTGQQTLAVDGAEAKLFAAFIVRREGSAVALEYWSMNVTDPSASQRARRALAATMRTEALAARGVAAADAAAIQALSPQFTHFDPRSADGSTGAPVSARDRAPFGAAFVLAFILWTAVISVANMLLTSTIEEKSNKILDNLLTCAAPAQILAGKLMGVAALSVTLFAFWGLMGGGAIALGAQSSPQAKTVLDAVLDPTLLAAFGFCFAIGYLMYGALFLAVGSLCETIQEAQTLVGPLFLLMAIPVVMFAPAVENPGSPAVAALSWFPLFTPFLLLLRTPAGLGVGEAAGLFAVMTLTLALTIWGAGRVFRAGATGQLTMTQLREALFGGKGRAGPRARGPSGG